MRRLVLNIAISLDGYICREDGSFDWIKGQGDTRYDTDKQFDNDAFFKSCDTVVMGMTSYRDIDMTELPDYEHKHIFVATHQQMENQPQVTFTDQILEDVKRLKKEDGSDIWLFGGASLAQQFIAEGLIDDYIIGIIPTILGKGVSLFSDQLNQLDLTLIDSTVTDGIAMLHYQPRKA